MANGQAEKAEAVRHPPACLIFVFTWEGGKFGIDISAGRQQQLRDLDDVLRRPLAQRSKLRVRPNSYRRSRSGMRRFPIGAALQWFGGACHSFSQRPSELIGSGVVSLTERLSPPNTRA